MWETSSFKVAFNDSNSAFDAANFVCAESTAACSDGLGGARKRSSPSPAPDWDLLDAVSGFPLFGVIKKPLGRDPSKEFLISSKRSERSFSPGDIGSAMTGMTMSSSGSADSTLSPPSSSPSSSPIGSSVFSSRDGRFRGTRSSTTAFSSPSSSSSSKSSSSSSKSASKRAFCTLNFICSASCCVAQGETSRMSGLAAVAAESALSKLSGRGAGGRRW
mmetsp:Transcript_52885/g.112917  ORF Transcript_52885/g.112917 Transcript_52885/m.112917 type:complete len:218 (-) Transcript_52885:51-704(-)